jgi:hypothetical protein
MKGIEDDHMPQDMSLMTIALQRIKYHSFTKAGLVAILLRAGNAYWHNAVKFLVLLTWW